MTNLAGKKAAALLLPFVLFFFFGLALFLRPQYPVQILEVVERFAREEKTGQRSSHRETVYYATVVVELDGIRHTVTVHDKTWIPLKEGDLVTVTKGLFGGIREYRTKNAQDLLLLSTFFLPLLVIVLWIFRKQKKVDGRRKPPAPQ